MSMTNTFEKDAASILQEWVKTAEQGGERDSYLSKRTTTRITWGESLTAEDVSRGSSKKVVHARARNISQKGLCFLSRTPIRLHTKLEIRVGDNPQTVLGAVVHCSTALAGYMIGVSFG
ncbi:MAG: PilZ domain-containing protein [Planctomycetes bacterium]|nr:PilZ domain-containing protein [Planctomycetota bacterium]